MENKCCAAYDYESAIKALSGVSGYTPSSRGINPDREELVRAERFHSEYEKNSAALVNVLGYIIRSDKDRYDALSRSYDYACQSRDKAHIAMQEIAEKLETTVDKNRELEAKLNAVLENEKTLKEENRKLHAENASLKNDNDIAVRTLKVLGADIPVRNYRQTVMIAAEDLNGGKEQ